MKILIDALFLRSQENGGGETYIRELLAALSEIDGENEYVVLTASDAAQAVGALGPNFTVRRAAISTRRVWLRLLYEQLVLPLLTFSIRPQVVFFPGNMISSGVAWLGVPVVVTIHDASFDFYRRRLPSYDSILKLRVRELLAKWAARFSTRVIAISEFTRREICRVSGNRGADIEVVYSGAPWHGGTAPVPNPVLQRFGVVTPYALTVGRVHKHKNVDTLVRAFAQMKAKSGLPHHLVVAGAAGTGQADLEAAIACCGAAAYVHQIGFVRPDDLMALYAGAAGFVMPSLYEGFGLPVLEAMQFGIPAAVSNTCSLPEIAGDAALYFDPESEVQMAGALERLLADPAVRDHLRRRGLAQAARFAWTDTAEQVLQVFRAAAGVAMPASAAAPKSVRAQSCTRI